MCLESFDVVNVRCTPPFTKLDRTCCELNRWKFSFVAERQRRSQNYEYSLFARNNFEWVKNRFVTNFVMSPKRKAPASTKKPTKKTKLNVDDEFDDEEEEILPKTTSRSRKTVEKTNEDDGDEKASCFGLSWEDAESDDSGKTPMFCFYDKNAVGRKKCIGFDMDFTIIKPKSGAKFAKGISKTF